MRILTFSSHRRRWLILSLLALLPLGALAADEPADEIIVVGRQPGPPLWKVSSGDRVLWIFPYINSVPEDMLWDSTRVARVIAESQEVIHAPMHGWMGSPLLWMNPVNLLRNERLNGRLERNPDGGKLQDNLPPELFARFVALQERYFPGNEYLREVRPVTAARTTMNAILRREGLADGGEVLKTIRRLVRRNRGIAQTEITVTTVIDSFSELAARLEAAYASYPREQEQACFEQTLRHLEEDLDALKSRANSWALGYVDEFRGAPLWEMGRSNACVELFRGGFSPEHDTAIGMITRMNQLWLDAAQRALATNASTFAILPIDELLAEDGLLNELKMKGYEVSEP